jgi:hypothetical protein
MAARDTIPKRETIAEMIDSMMKPRPKVDGESDADRKKRIAENAYQAKIRRLAKKHGLGAGAEGVHYILDGKDNPLVQAANEVFAKARRRKVN